MITNHAWAQQGTRQLGPHQHGHGQFHLVIEGRKATMELHIPGHDITGFEHKPSTPAQIAVMNKARAQLRAGLELFVLPAAARCKLASVTVATAKEEHHDGEDDDDGDAHMEFRVHYALDCGAPQKLDRIRFDFFKKFPSAQVLEMMFISDEGQRVYNITAANPVAELDAR